MKRHTVILLTDKQVDLTAIVPPGEETVMVRNSGLDHAIANGILLESITATLESLRKTYMFSPHDVVYVVTDSTPQCLGAIIVIMGFYSVFATPVHVWIIAEKDRYLNVDQFRAEGYDLAYRLNELLKLTLHQPDGTLHQ